MEKIVLKSQERQNWENLKSIRASRMIPAVVYWLKQKPINIKIHNSDLLRAYRNAWKNHIIQLNIDTKKIDVLIHDFQKAPVNWDFLHIDFYAIVKGEKVTTQIPLKFIWNSKAKTEENAVIEELIKELEVKCLPQDLINSFEIDLSKLEKIWDNIKVWDLSFPSNIEILNEIDEVIVLATKPKVEKIEEPTISIETEEEKTIETVEDKKSKE